MQYSPTVDFAQDGQTHSSKFKRGGGGGGEGGQIQIQGWYPILNIRKANFPGGGGGGRGG